MQNLVLRIPARPVKWHSPNYPKKILGSLGLHHIPLEPSTIIVEWQEGEEKTKLDEKNI